MRSAAVKTRRPSATTGAVSTTPAVRKRQRSWPVVASAAWRTLPRSKPGELRLAAGGQPSALDRRGGRTGTGHGAGAAVVGVRCPLPDRRSESVRREEETEMLTLVDRRAEIGADDASWPPGLVTAADRARWAAFAGALGFYEGHQWPGALRARRRRGEVRLTFNYARALMRKTASYVFPAPVTFSVPASGPEEEAAARRAELALAEAAAANDLGRLDVALCLEAAV